MSISLLMCVIVTEAFFLGGENLSKGGPEMCGLQLQAGPRHFFEKKTSLKLRGSGKERSLDASSLPRIVRGLLPNSSTR